MIAVYKKKMRVRDSCERLAALGCAREVRARAAMRVLSVALAALLVMTLFPSRLLADGLNANIISGPTFVPVVDMYGSSVAAPDRYTAAALLMGYSADAISSWDDEVKAKLSNASTGGDFYTFATLSVQNYYDVTDGDGVFWAFIQFVGGAFWDIAQTLYGNNLWAAMYTQDELNSARAALEDVLNGGGGSGGGSVDGDYYVFDFKPIGSVLSGVNSVYVSKSVVAFTNATVGFENAIKSGCIVVYPTTNGTTSVYMAALYFSSETNPTYAMTDDGTHYQSMYFNVNNGQYVDASSSHTYTGRIDGDKFYIDYDGYVRPVDAFQTKSYNRSLYYQYSYGAGILQTNTVTPVPPTNWPDEPSAPSPPELPEPSDPTVDPPEPYDPYEPVVDPPAPYDPTGGDTYIYNITNVTEPTDTSSILEWVKKIFYELKALHSDLSTWLQNLGSALDKLRVTLNNGFAQLYGAIDDVESDIQDVVSAVDNANRQIYNRIGDFWTNLKSEYMSLKQYLRQLFNWLGEKMNFTAEGYDDTSVIYWLKRIWGKLGSGDVNVRPTDPTVDPPAWWEWLNRMLDSLLDGLVGVFNNLLGGTGDLLEEVIHQFPFSIPWDIAAFLTVLVAPPVTPVFDIVIPAIDNWWPEYTIHVDMAPFDTAAATIRLMTKVVFAGCLAWKSRELLDMMDVTKW